MKTIFPLLILLVMIACQPAENPQTQVMEEAAPNEDIRLSVEEAGRLSQMAYHCIAQEYPNKLNQVLAGEDELAGPKALHPAFYGCFDWHSAVHGHWSLVRILKAFPDIEQAGAIRERLAANLTPENIQQEVAYFAQPHNKNFERTYGWAWLLKLAEELHTWKDPQAREWETALQPLTDLMVGKYLAFLPKLGYPIRIGEHSNTAFGLAFAHDYAVTLGKTELQNLIESRAKAFYADDQACPVSWEPGGFDFLSPCLEEADIMSRVLPAAEFERWFTAFLPNWQSLQPAVVSDRSDGKIVHLDGLNFSRAWVLYSLASRLPDQKNVLVSLADGHMAASLPKMTSGDYAGEHWLASFALYALQTKAGLQ
ncbi:MAG: DUF2891 domain-containing protein [Bacteroidota bacterium]